MNAGRPAPPTDAELVCRALEARDPAARAAAGSELLQRYHARVFQWCHAQLGDPDLAADVAQEVLLKAYHGLAGFAGRSQFSSWLFAIVRNRCLDELRSRRPPGDPDAVDELVDDAVSALGRLEAASEREAWLRRLRRYLAPREQEAVYLRYFENMPLEEITRLLDLDQSTGARAVLQTARRKLRAALAGKRRFDHD